MYRQWGFWCVLHLLLHERRTPLQAGGWSRQLSEPFFYMCENVWMHLLENWRKQIWREGRKEGNECSHAPLLCITPLFSAEAPVKKKKTAIFSLSVIRKQNSTIVQRQFSVEASQDNADQTALDLSPFDTGSSIEAYWADDYWRFYSVSPCYVCTGA